MFCGKCGAPNDDGAQFCKNCGAPLTAAPAAAQASAPPAKQPDHKKIGIIATAAAALLVVVILVVLLGGRSAEKTAGKFIDAIFHADGKTIVSLIPKDMADSLFAQLGFDARGELVDFMSERLKGSTEYYDRAFGKWSYSYKIIETEDYGGKELSNLSDRYESAFDFEVTAAKTVSVKVTIKYDGGSESKTLDITTIKVGGSWYIDYLSMSGYFS